MTARLAYVALAARDPDAVAATLERHFGLPRTAVPPIANAPALAVGETALVLLAPDDPRLAAPGRAGVDHIAFAGDAELDPVACGVHIRSCPPFEIASATTGMVERLDHLGVASDDNAAALAAFCGRYGFPLESQQRDVEARIAVESFTSDRYGLVYHSRPPEIVGGLHVAFVTVGDCELEFLQDLDPAAGTRIDHGSPGTTKQDQSAIGRFVARRGPGLHHLAFKTPDIDAALAALDRAGLRLIDRTGRPGSRRARIGFVHPEALGGVLVHFVERTPA